MVFAEAVFIVFLNSLSWTYSLSIYRLPGILQGLLITFPPIRKSNIFIEKKLENPEKNKDENKNTNRL